MTKDSTIEQIAAEHLGVKTLETRKSDRLDFHDLAVWKIREALDEAFEAGRRHALEHDAETNETSTPKM